MASAEGLQWRSIVEKKDNAAVQMSSLLCGGRKCPDELIPQMAESTNHQKIQKEPVAGALVQEIGCPFLALRRLACV